MSPTEARHPFAPPFSMRLLGGFKANLASQPVDGLEAVLGVSLELADDLELGGAFYSYAPYPAPETGLVGVRLHINDIPGLGPANTDRPDLVSLLSIELRGSQLLDLGRLAGQLERAYPGLYAVAEYSVASLPPPGSLALDPLVHWVQFRASPPGGDSPLAEAPTLDGLIEFELAAIDQAAALDRLSSLSDARHSSIIDGPRARLTVQFTARSLLELGRCAQEVERAPGGAVKVLGYRVAGDLLRDGGLVRLEERF